MAKWIQVLLVLISALAANGNCLQGYEWKTPGTALRAAMVLVHGIHDHPGRYTGLAEALAAKGVVVYAFDQRGHGDCGGARAVVGTLSLLVPARTIDAILDGVIGLQPLMSAITVPVLILHGGADAVTPASGSRKLAQQVGSKDKKLVIFEPALHSLLQEPEAPLVLAEIVAFADARAARP